MERHFRTKLELSRGDDNEIYFDPNWKNFETFLTALIKSPIITKLNKFKRLLDPSIRTEYDPYVDKNAIDDPDNKDFKQLSDILQADTKFEFFEQKLIKVIQSDWNNGENEKEQAEKYRKIKGINSD